MNEAKTLSVPQAAKILGVGIASAYAGIKRGEIPAIRIGGRLLVPKPALEKMLSGETASEQQRK
ncbi:MAG: helix-turn-helix domain-containing protein [Armatimonadota bacterium]